MLVVWSKKLSQINSHISCWFPVSRAPWVLVICIGYRDRSKLLHHTPFKNAISTSLLDGTSSCFAGKPLHTPHLVGENLMDDNDFVSKPIEAIGDRPWLKNHTITWLVIISHHSSKLNIIKPYDQIHVNITWNTKPMIYIYLNHLWYGLSIYLSIYFNHFNGTSCIDRVATSPRFTAFLRSTRCAAAKPWATPTARPAAPGRGPGCSWGENHAKTVGITRNDNHWMGIWMGYITIYNQQYVMVMQLRLLMSTVSLWDSNLHSVGYIPYNPPMSGAIVVYVNDLSATL